MPICPDCPDLDNDIERPTTPGWIPRARCCRDEHIDRRAAGDTRDWEGEDKAREISAKEAAAGVTPTRQQRRAEARKRSA